MQKRWQGSHLLEYFLSFNFVVATPANKIGMFLLQILDKADRLTAAANAFGHARFVRAEVEMEREVATDLSGRAIAAVVLHAAHIRAVAVACGRQEDCTSGFEFRPLLGSERLVLTVCFYTQFAMET